MRSIAILECTKENKGDFVMRNIGIDFGTCNIKGAEKKKDGTVRNIKLGKHIEKAMIPNVVLYEKKEDGYSVLIGDVALRKAALEQDKIRNIKSFLQEADWERTLTFGKKVSAYDVTFEIMKSLYEYIHNTNKDEEVSVTITVPVNFSKRQQLIVEKAAKEAGFDVKYIITEPFAALFSLMKEAIENGEEHNVLIFDFGGGTLDLCLATITEKNDEVKIETQSTVGISYGGNNINEDILRELVQKRAAKKLSMALDKQENVLRREVNKYFILEALDAMKAEMFEEDSVDEDEEYDLTARLFDGSAVDLGSYSVNDIYQMFDENKWEKRIFSLLDNLFEDSVDLIPDEVTDVFTIGGTSSIPYFRNCICKYFEKKGHEDILGLFELNDEINSEDIYYSVSKGAAIFHEIMEEGNIEIKDRIPFVVYSKDEKEKVCTRISMDVCYKGCSSPWANISEAIKRKECIGVYQKIHGEDEKEVYLGEIKLDKDILEVATLYRLVVDEKRNVYVEFAHLSDSKSENLEDTICIDWCRRLEINI